jgi:hypothetical protein
MFRKEAGSLVLYEVMPWMPEMEDIITPEELHEQQESDFEGICRYFEAARVNVKRGTDDRH